MSDKESKQDDDAGRQRKIRPPRKPRPATPKEIKFAENIAQGMTKGKAALAAGYGSEKSASVAASRLLQRAVVREAIAERIAEAHVEPNEVIGTLAAQMRGNILWCLNERNQLDIETIRQNGVGHLIKEWTEVERSISHPKGGRPTVVKTIHVKLYSAVDAAKALARILGLEKEPARNPHDEARRLYQALRRNEKYAQVSDSELRTRVAQRFQIDPEMIKIETVM